MPSQSWRPRGTGRLAMDRKHAFSFRETAPTANLKRMWMKNRSNLCESCGVYWGNITEFSKETSQNTTINIRLPEIPAKVRMNTSLIQARRYFTWTALLINATKSNNTSYKFLVHAGMSYALNNFGDWCSLWRFSSDLCYMKSQNVPIYTLLHDYLYSTWVIISKSYFHMSAVTLPVTQCAWRKKARICNCSGSSTKAIPVTSRGGP
jgi:hypothetical protein